MEFLKDVQACYSFFQDDVARASHIVGTEIREAAIWLNLDTTELDTVTPEQIMASVIAADRLCINAVCLHQLAFSQFLSTLRHKDMS